MHFKILIEISNNIYSFFLFSLIFTVILLASSGGYTALKQRKEMSIVMVLCLATIAFSCMVFALVITGLTDAPCRNGRRLIGMWKWKVGDIKENLRRLKAISDIGYRVGLMRHARNTLGIIMIDIIVQLTVNIMLIQ